MKRETIKHKFIVHRHSNVIRVTTTLQHCYNIVTTTSFMSQQRHNNVIDVTTSSFMSQQRHNNVIDVTTSSFMSQNVWPMFTSLIQTKSSITLQINILSIIFRSFFPGFSFKRNCWNDSIRRNVHRCNQTMSAETIRNFMIY